MFQRPAEERVAPNALRAVEVRLEVEDCPAGALESLNASIEVSGLHVELVKPRTHLASFCDEPRVISKAMADSIERVTRRGIEPGIAHQVIGDEKWRSHNAAYVTRPVVPRAFSTGRST